MVWRDLAPMAQTLLYGAGIVALVLLVLVGYQSNERMQREHERMMLITDQTLRDIMQR